MAPVGAGLKVDASNSARLRRRWLALAQAAWTVCAAGALLIFLAAIPLGYSLRLSGTLIGPTIDAPPWYVAATIMADGVASMLAALVSLGLAAVLFWKKRDEPMALFVSFFLLTYGIGVAGPLEYLNGPYPASPGVPAQSGMLIPTEVIFGVGAFLFFVPMPLLLYLFPNGRFVPTWSRYASAALVLLAPALIHFFSGEWFLAMAPLDLLLVGTGSILLFAGLYAQVYRYRRVASAIERQQSKWVIVGLILTFVVMFVLQIPYIVRLQIPAGIALPWWTPLIDIGWWLSINILPLSLALAVMRYRLWDIDILINRTLVYSALTAAILGLYAVVVGAFGTFLQGNGNAAGFLLATVLFAFLFQPLRARLQRGVDKLMYSGQGPMNAEHADRLGEETSAPPRRRWLPAAQFAWLVSAALAGLVLLVSIPVGYAQYVNQPTPIGTIDAPAVYVTVLYIASAVVSFLVALISLVLAGLLFWKRRDEPIALFVSFFLLAYGLGSGGPTEILGHQIPLIANLLIQVQAALIGAPIVLLLYVMPNGRFVPGWTRWAALLMLLLTPVLMAIAPVWSLGMMNPSVGLVALAYFALIGVGIYAQIYRFRRAASVIERQQTKWIMFGLVLNVTLEAILSIPYAFLQSMPSGVKLPWWTPLSDLTWWLVVSIPPLAIAIAVMRYRLWDVDILINRTLVYGALTAGIVALYVLLVGAMGALSQTSGNLLTSLLATGLIALLFQPLRERFQRGVNRLLYGERDEPYALMARLGRDLETTIAPDAILDTLVRTIAQALKLPYVAIETGRGDEVIIAAAYGLPLLATQHIPLTYQSETAGYLLVAPRSPNEPLSARDLNLLRMIAQQAGMAVHAVQLTADLQRSRERLVVAREEERRRIRRDLHDGLGPALASLAMQADSAREWTHTDPKRAEAALADMTVQTQAALQDIRRLVYGLRPPALDELGLMGALRQTAANYASGVQIEIDAPEPLPPLPAAVEVAAYRIAQETLNNIMRHAQARHCSLRVCVRNGLELVITDDGVGLPSALHAGVGLLSMRERAAELGGSCVIESVQGGGTRVTARLPLVNA